jgi:hypothetical protein
MSTNWRTTLAGLVAALAMVAANLPHGITWQEGLKALAVAALGFFARDNHGPVVALMPLAQGGNAELRIVPKADPHEGTP